VIFILCLLPILDSDAQTDTSFVLDLDINVWMLPTQTYRLVYLGEKCFVNGIKYNFRDKDSLLSRYFDNLETILGDYSYRRLGNYSYSKNGKMTGMWTDGSRTKGIVVMNGDKKEFNFHSGNSDYDSLQIEMMNTFFNIMFYLTENEKFAKKFTDENRYYLEHMETSCTRNAMRKVKESPLRYKLFERVYTFNCEQVVAIFDSFPKDEPVDVEIGRFFNLNIHDKFYEIFKMDISKRENINWIVYQNNKDYLLSIGLQEKKVKETKEYLSRPE
jgi:hypothetical protein